MSIARSGARPARRGCCSGRPRRSTAARRIKDYRYSQVLSEEIYGTGSAGLGFGLQSDVMPPYLLDLSNDEQKARWLPRSVSGDLIWGLAISEPGAGSDVASLITTAVRDGDSYVINGAKTFITNGILLDAVVVAVKTDPAGRHKGISLIVVEAGMPGFERGRHLDKIGQRSQDTSELFFRDVRVPAANLLGEVNQGFGYLMSNLPQERLGAGVAATAVMWRALSLTIDYVRSRKAFGQTLGGFQNTRFELAEVKTLCEVAQAYVDKAVVGARSRQAVRRGCRRAQAVDHRYAMPGRRPLPATVRRLRLHERVRDRAALA